MGPTRQTVKAGSNEVHGGPTDSDALFRVLADTAPVMVWIAGPDKLCTFFNTPWLDFTGRTLEQELGNGWLDGVHPDDLARCMDTYVSAFDARKAFTMEYRLQRADGVFRWILDTGVAYETPDGSFAGYVGSCIDISDRKEMEDALRDSEERNRAFFEFTTVGASECRLSDGRFIRVNDALCDITGYTHTELLTMDFGDLLHPEDRERAFEDLGRLGSGEMQGPGSDQRCVRKDGSVIWTHAAVSVVQSSGEDPGSVFSIVQDITDRKEAERELQELASRLLQSQDDERRRIAQELHDETAQNVFAINLNLNQLLAEHPELDSEARRLVIETLGLGEQVLREIRTLSYVLHPPLLDQLGLQAAVEWYVDGFVKRSGIQVELEMPPQEIGRLPPEVETALFRVVQESLTNIHRHTESEWASILLASEPDRVVLEVKDSGQGMTDKAAESTEDFQYLGVGISGMRQRVRQLGGELEMRSSRAGTRVTATVPLGHGAGHD